MDDLQPPLILQVLVGLADNSNTTNGTATSSSDSAKLNEASNYIFMVGSLISVLANCFVFLSMLFELKRCRSWRERMRDRLPVWKNKQNAAASPRVAKVSANVELPTVADPASPQESSSSATATTATATSDAIRVDQHQDNKEITSDEDDEEEEENIEEEYQEEEKPKQKGQTFPPPTATEQQSQEAQQQRQDKRRRATTIRGDNDRRSISSSRLSGLMRKCIIMMAISDVILFALFFATRAHRLVGPKRYGTKAYNEIYWVLLPATLGVNLASQVWSVCVSISIMLATNAIKYREQRVQNKFFIAFNVIAATIGFIDFLFWLIYREIRINRDDAIVSAAEDRGMEAFFQLSHAIFFTILFLLDVFLLIAIWIRLKILFSRSTFAHAAKKEQVKREHMRKHLQIIFRFSLFILPVVFCGSWQMYVLFFNGQFVLRAETWNNQMRILTSPVLYLLYSIFFPLSGVLRVVVFYLHSNYSLWSIYRWCLCCVRCCIKPHDDNKEESINNNNIKSINKNNNKEPTATMNAV